jgi:hypothetical protein
MRHLVISGGYDVCMETNQDHIKITTVRIGNGTKVHYAVDGAAVTFCNLYRGIRKAHGAEATCERCAESVLAGDHADKVGK